jgi:hypothetical protein
MLRRTQLILYSAPVLLGILTQLAFSSDKRAQPDRVAYTSWQPTSNWDIYLFCSERRGNPDKGAIWSKRTLSSDNG